MSVSRHCSEEVDELEGAQSRARGVIQVLENMVNEERIKLLGLWVCGCVIISFICLKG